MKYLLLLTACAVWVGAGAQTEGGKLPNLADRIEALKNLQRYSTGTVQKDTGKQSRGTTLFFTHPKPGVHRLPQDGMPCIVPDPNATVAMPNLWRGEVKVPFQGHAPRIPNSAKRNRLAPSRPLLVQPEKEGVGR